ncbi:hypothetical protein GCM10027289_17630 [Tsukamurella serpentis]
MQRIDALRYGRGMVTHEDPDGVPTTLQLLPEAVGVNIEGAPAPLWATWGLFAAWLVHDFEEVLTMPGWTAREHYTFGHRRLSVPPMSTTQARVAIGVAGVLVATAAECGRRSGGRSRLYQWSLTAFGWHGAVHIANSVVTRGYSPGVATVLPVVIPFYLAANKALSVRGIAVPNRAAGAGAALVATLGVAHGIARIVNDND